MAFLRRNRIAHDRLGKSIWTFEAELLAYEARVPATRMVVDGRPLDPARECAFDLAMGAIRLLAAGGVVRVEKLSQ